MKEKRKVGSVELRDYLLILRKRWIVILALTLVGIATGAAATLLQTPKYEASTLVFVSVPSSNNAGDLAQGGSFVQNQVASYAEVVSTPRVLNSVIKQLHLSVSASKLAESVSANAPQSTVNIEIVVTADSPTDAANIANATTASFSKTIASITTPPGGGASQVSVSVLRDATVPSSPSSPNTPLNLALGLLVGLAIGIAVAVLREVLDTLVRGERDVTAITTSPIIGGLAFDPSAVKRPLIVHDDPQSVRAEAFRTLRTNLQFLDANSGSKSFVITSSVPGEGKTTTAANLAIALSDSGLHVAVIDADLRRPKLADYLGLEGAIGLSDVLISRVALADALQPWGRRHLVVLPAGTVPPNPSELLGSRAMATLLKTLEAEFDVVILDMPPLLPVTDAALVSKLVRGTLVVAAAGRVRKGEFAAALANLEKVSTPAAGIIMTMLPTKGPDAYGLYGYGYGYGQHRYSSASAPNSRTEAATALGLVPQSRAGLAEDWGRPDSKVRV